MVLFDGCSDVSLDFEQFPLGLLVRITLPLFFFDCSLLLQSQVGEYWIQRKRHEIHPCAKNWSRWHNDDDHDDHGDHACLMMMMMMIMMLASVPSDLHAHPPRKVYPGAEERARWLLPQVKIFNETTCICTCICMCFCMCVFAFVCYITLSFWTLTGFHWILEHLLRSLRRCEHHHPPHSWPELQKAGKKQLAKKNKKQGKSNHICEKSTLFKIWGFF